MTTQLDLFEKHGYTSVIEARREGITPPAAKNDTMAARKLDRGYSEIIKALTALRDRFEAAEDHNRAVMAEAIAWGYSTARTNHNLESRLYRAPDLEAVIIELSANWDGNDYLNGSLRIANRFYIDPIPYTR